MALDSEALFYSRLRDTVSRSFESYIPVFEGFLNDKEQFLAEKFLKRQNSVDYVFFGGYNGAQRKLLSVFPSGFEPEEENFPLSIIQITYNNAFSLTHRDFLGCFMALGLKRETIGDILVSNGKALAIVKEEISSYILSQISKIGSVGVKLQIIEAINNEDIPKQNFKEINCTVASLRLDNICSAVTNLSREKACKLITSSLVCVNYTETTSVSFSVKKDDVITIRGYGKFIIYEINGTTKKGREKLIIKQYS